MESIRELLANSQQLISRAIWTSKLRNSRAYKRMEEGEGEMTRMYEENNK